MVRLVTLALLAVAACGNIGRNQNRYDAAGPQDSGIDSAEPVDAPPDSAPLREAREFVSGGMRMTGTTYTFDVQLGHVVQQSKTVGPTYQFEGNAAVKP
jgi:hypothetical protein